MQRLTAYLTQNNGRHLYNSGVSARIFGAAPYNVLIYEMSKSMRLASIQSMVTACASYVAPDNC